MKTLLLAVAGALSLTVIGEGQSQKYPTKPVRIIIPFTAGSQTDVLARVIGAKLAETSATRSCPTTARAPAASWPATSSPAPTRTGRRSC